MIQYRKYFYNRTYKYNRIENPLETIALALRPNRQPPIRSPQRGKRENFTHKFIIYCQGKKGRGSDGRGRVALPDQCLYVEIKSPETVLLPLLEKELKKQNGSGFRIVKYKPEILKLFPRFEIARCNSTEQLLGHLGTLKDAGSADGGWGQ